MACLGDSRELPVRASALRKTLVLFPHQAPSRGGRFEKFKEAWDLLAG